MVEAQVDSREVSSSARRKLTRSSEQADRGPGSISLIRIANLLLRHRVATIVLPFASAALLVATAFITPRTYTAEASFVPETGQDEVSRLAGLAARFGVSVPGSEAGRSAAFYADLLRTRELLMVAVEDGYEPPNGETPVGLAELFDVGGRSEASRRERALEELEERMEVSVNPETGIVRLTMSTPWPAVSRQVVERLLELVDRFDHESRVSRASAERRFIEGRLASAERELRGAEDRLKRFLEENRRYENSPELRFEHDRLDREVALRERLYASLAESYERARIDEVRDTPAVTVVQPPDVAADPDSRRLGTRVVLGLIFGALIASAWIFGREAFERSAWEEPEERAEFMRLRSAAWKDVARRVGGLAPWRKKG